MAEEKAIPKLDASYDVVVVGAGNGGLAAALTSAVKGAKVLLLEQHNLPGGFATSFVRGRFEFEASLHELSSVGPGSNKGGVRVFLEDEAGVDIDWVAVPEAYRLILTDDNIDVALPFGKENFIAAIEKEVPGSREPIEKYVALCQDVHDALGTAGRFSDKPGMNDLLSMLSDPSGTFGELKSIAPRMLNMLKTLPCTVEEVTSTFNIPEKALKILYPYWCYLGLPMSRMSFTLWAAMLASYLTHGAYIPRNRSHELASAIEARILRLGGRVEYNTRVEKILVEKGQVTGVVTSAGDTISTRAVICNASPTLAFNNLIHPRSEVPDDAFRTINARKTAYTGFVVYLGLDAPADQLGINDYGYFISNNMDTDQIYKNTAKIGLTPMQATICLNNAIPGCSPPGTSMLTITTMYLPEAWQDIRPEMYFKIKNDIASAMIEQFENATRIGVRQHIEEIEVATPVTFARYTRCFMGGIYGYEPEPWDSVVPRVLAQKDETYIRGLEFAGGASIMCHGYSSALMSGRSAALAALRKLGVKS